LYFETAAIQAVVYRCLRLLVALNLGGFGVVVSKKRYIEDDSTLTRKTAGKKPVAAHEECARVLPVTEFENRELFLCLRIIISSSIKLLCQLASFAMNLQRKLAPIQQCS